MAKARTQAERSDATKALLLKSAQDMFGTRGYAASSIEEIVSEAGVTKGAYYHHFDSKSCIFRAVFEIEERALTEHLRSAAAGAPDAWSRLKKQCMLLLDACLNPALRQIYLLDGPAVLGWEVVRKIESNSSVQLFRTGLEAAAAEGQLASDDVASLTYLLFGAMCEGIMVTARADDREQARVAMGRQVEVLLRGLRK